MLMYAPQHRFAVTWDSLIKCQSYCVSSAKRKVIKELVEEMLAADVAEPSSSAWVSPVVLIPKRKDSSGSVPLALKKAPGTFQRLMEMLLFDLPG